MVTFSEVLTILEATPANLAGFSALLDQLETVSTSITESSVWDSSLWDAGHWDWTVLGLFSKMLEVLEATS